MHAQYTSCCPSHTHSFSTATGASEALTKTYFVSNTHFNETSYKSAVFSPSHLNTLRAFFSSWFNDPDIVDLHSVTLHFIGNQHTHKTGKPFEIHHPLIRLVWQRCELEGVPEQCRIAICRPFPASGSSAHRISLDFTAQKFREAVISGVQVPTAIGIPAESPLPFHKS